MSKTFILFVFFLIFSISRSENYLEKIKAFDFETYLKSDKFLKTLNSTNGIEECRKHVLQWLDGLENGELWALQMVDSITKFMDGFFMGRTHVPGHFDECVEANNTEFRGKHCVITAALKLNNVTTIKAEEMQMNVIYNYGICVPSTCTPSNINYFLQNLNLVDFIEFQNMTEHDCSTGELRSFRTEDWITVCVIGSIVLLATISTLYDVRQRFGLKNETPHEFLTSFSLYTNAKSLFTISKGGTQLKFIFGIRFISMIWVVLGHSYITYAFGFPINLGVLAQFFTDSSMVVINNGYVTVDTFFFLSGLLFCVVFFRDLAKKGTFDIPVSFIHRYIRVTPPFVLIILIQSTIVSRSANGPFWNKLIDKIEHDCRESWWTAILYIQNYVKPELLCLGQSWYLSADMQMFWLGPFFAYPLLIWPKFAPVFLGLVISAAALSNFSIAYIGELHPNLSIGLKKGILAQFQDDYIPLQTRMAPWLIGLATGYVVCGLRAKKISFNPPKPLIIIGWIVSFGLCLGSLLGIIRFYFYKYTTLESALYLAFHRVGWALGLSWTVIACVSGHGGPINFFFSLSIFEPLAKLTYCNFLIHMSLQYYRLFSSRTNQYIRHFDIVYAFAGDVFLSFLLAIPATLLFEMPFVNLDRYIFRNVKILPFPKILKNRTYLVNEIDKSFHQELKECVERGKVNPGFREI